jgi:DNA-binding transcriptional MerR regulator
VARSLPLARAPEITGKVVGYTAGKQFAGSSQQPDCEPATVSMPSVDAAQIPNRSLFRQPEVCDIAQVQPYVLRSWEAEFPDLGVAKVQGGPRIYRKADVERVLKIKHLLFVDGLTLAGARRKLQEEQPSAAPDGSALDDLLSSDLRERILRLRQSLRELSAILARKPGTDSGEFALAAPAARKPAPKRASAPAVASRPAARRKTR